MYQKIPAGLRRLTEYVADRVPGMRGSVLKGSVRLAKKMARSGSLSPVERFVMNGTYLNAQEKASLYADPMREQIAGFDPGVQHLSKFEQVKNADFLNQMLYLDTKIFMTSLNLTYNDKMSMASSVEVRVPFLDKELAEFVAWNVPPAMKLNGRFNPTTKYIFRKAMQDVLPEEVLKQPKAGFAAPVDYWLANDLREMTDDLLSESRVRERGLFRPEVVRSFVAEHRSGAQDWSMQIWQFLTLEIWMKTFLDSSTSPEFGNHVNNFARPYEVATA
jgi:asparagine synthase (glutamine-hydrolysing)